MRQVRLGAYNSYSLAALIPQLNEAINRFNDDDNMLLYRHLVIVSRWWNQQIWFSFWGSFVFSRLSRARTTGLLLYLVRLYTCSCTGFCGKSTGGQKGTWDEKSKSLQSRKMLGTTSLVRERREMMYRITPRPVSVSTWLATFSSWPVYIRMWPTCLASNR